MKARHFLLVLMLFAHTGILLASVATALLLPKPQQLTENGASFALNRDVAITDPTNSTLLASLFTVNNSASATVTVTIVDATTLGTFDYTLAGFDNEGYKLNVTNDAITITAVTKTGVIRAAQTLMQLAAATNGASIPGVEITDYPAFKLRGFMHDVGRSFISFDELKKEIDLLSRFKVNVFHWHLTDNQGFRFESKVYPQLNQAANMTRFAGSFYTQAQCTELEAYAAERGIIVIPEIDMPGHSTAFTNAMGYTMSSDEGKVALKALLNELADAFPLAPYIHMGADEAGTTAAFVNEMSQYIKETLGRKCIVWNPISGVSISTSTLPYIDMTEMWSTSGRKIGGLPNIDCRYNYVNHFDVFADLVGIYKSNVYYAQQGSSEVAGAITAIWNDRKTATETDIISQNGLYAHALATAERGWMGGGNQYIEVGGTTLPNSGSEFEAFADWERRFLHYKDTWLSNEPIPYVKQTNVKWRITQAFPNEGDASTAFPPETSTDEILPDEYTYNGQTYTTSMATGAGIYLRHVWGTTVPAFYTSPQLNTTAYAWTYVYSPTEQTAGALIEFQNYSRSENDKAPDAGNWDRKGSRIWVNGTEVAPPTWTNSGVNINSEVDLGNENFPAREPISILLHAGWNKVLLKLPYVNASNIRLNKWMFTFVLTDATGQNALDNITYSPIQSLDENVEIVVAKIGEIKTYINSVCSTKVGYYPVSAAATLNAAVAEVEATLQTTMTATEREAQVATLQTAFEAFQSSLSSQTINQPTASTSAESHYYTLCTPLRGSRYATSTGAGGELAGGTTVTAASCWKFVSRGDGTYDIVNVYDNSYVLPNSSNNTVLKTQATAPSAGWTISKADEAGYVIITSGSCQFNQTNTSSSALSGGYKIYNWGSGTNTTDTGCKYVINEIAEDDIPFPLSSTALDELTNYDISIAAAATTSITTGQWYVMKNVGRNGYLYEKVSDHKLYNQAATPGGSAADNAQFLVRFVSGESGKYYIQNGLGNYMGAIPQDTPVPMTALRKEQVSITQIGSNAGYFYVRGTTDDRILDCKENGYGVVGWGTDAPTATNSNAAWQIYPVTLVDSWDPTASEVYTINNTKASNRGALVYDGSSTNVGLVASASLTATNVNHQWVLYPTGAEKQYYLYNVGAGKFAIPTAIAQSASNPWVFSDNAVAVTLLSQGDGTYRIKMATDPVNGTNEAVIGVNQNTAIKVFNYNDAGSDFTFTKVDAANQSTAVTEAVAKLVKSQTALATYPNTTGWYAIQIKSKSGAASYAGRYLKTAASLYNSLYPLTFTGGVDVQPAITDATYFTYLNCTSWDVNTWQLPDGRYLVENSSSKFPTPSATAGNVICGYDNGNYFKSDNNLYADPYNSNANYFIGETSYKRTSYSVYPIDLATAGLTAWQVSITNAGSSTQLTCNRSDVCGMNTVYNNGWFILPTGVTPEASDFTMEGMMGVPVIDTTNKTITATYDPSISFLSDNVSVCQGNETTGKGNTMQALLRVKVTPFATCIPTKFNITLTGASQLDKVAVYTTTIDEIRAAAASPVKIGEAVAANGTVEITVTASEHAANTSLYYWITANVKATATELETIDASLNSIAYSNANGGNTCDVSSVGNPNGEMRIYKQQTALWTPDHANTIYYRIPTMLRTSDNDIVALADYRHDHPYDLGKSASNGYGAHVIDVVSRRSTDGGLTWQDEVVVAAGDGTTAAGYGYGDPAIVADADGTLHCLMAAGSASYASGSGMLHMGYSKSTDKGASWSAVTDIYNAIDKDGLTISSAFTTGGKGVTFANGRMAFAFLGKVSGTTNVYPLYSDDKGATWKLSSAVAYGGGDESKFEIMNDNSLLVSVRKGGFNGTALRAYNRTTGDASGDGIGNWGTATNWGSEMNANGCNADILYYNRSTENASRPDVIFHTLTKTYSTYRKDLRLYMSFDQGETWKEAFQLQPGYAAYSSLQKLANGDLAVIYEDGSLGNQDKQDCYAMNYLVISSETINAKIDELYSQMHHPVATIISQGETNTSAPWGSWSPTSGWANKFTTNASAGVAGVEVSATTNAFNRESDYGQRVFVIKPSAAGATDEITITAPAGYIIKGYSIGGHYYTASEKYTLTSADGTQSAEVNTNSGNPNMLTVDNLYAKSTTFTIKSNGSTNNRYACITQFTVTLSDDYPVSLNAISGKSYATLYLPFDVTVDDNTKAYYITTANNGYAQLTATSEEGTEIPALTAVVLVNTNASTNATFSVASGLSSVVSEDANLLKGTLVPMSLDLSNASNYYSLGVNEGRVGFFKYNNGGITSITLGANKAYLNVPGSLSPSKGFTFGFDETNSIGNSLLTIDNLQFGEGSIYDLSGRKVMSTLPDSHTPTLLKKGIYIMNGKKIVVK